MSEPTQPDAGAPAPEPIAPAPEPSSPPPASDAPITAREAATLISEQAGSSNRPTRLTPPLPRSPAARLTATTLRRSPSTPRGHGPRQTRKLLRSSPETPRNASWRSTGHASWNCAAARTKPPSNARPPRPWRSRRNRHKHRHEQHTSRTYRRRRCCWMPSIERNSERPPGPNSRNGNVTTLSNTRRGIWPTNRHARLLGRMKAAAGPASPAAAAAAAAFLQNAEAWKAQETEKFLEKAPEWKDPETYGEKVAEVMNYLEKDIGFERGVSQRAANEYLPIQIHDHRSRLMVWKSLPLRRGSEGCQARHARPVPPVQRPGCRSRKGRGQRGSVQRPQPSIGPLRQCSGCSKAHCGNERR